MAPRRDPGAGGSELHLSNGIRLRARMVSEEVEERCPVHAVGARLGRDVPPVAGAGLLVDREVVVKAGQVLPHLRSCPTGTLSSASP